MLDYGTARDLLLRASYRQQIKKVVARYRRGRPTMVLLPGGMGSQLERSPRQHDGSVPAFDSFDPVWIDQGIILQGDGLKIEIDAAGRDIDGFFVIPNGPLDFLVRGYDRTAEWAALNGFNYAVFGYDWRRPINEAAAYLGFFLDVLRKEVIAQRGEDPAPRTVLVGHSQGGLVTQMFVQMVVLTEFANAVVTVGTPFYGAWNHGDRYYVGQSPLDILHTKREVARIASTLPGPYVLMPLDKAIFARDWRAIGFGSAGDYPVLDRKTKAPTDIYDPNNLGRFPVWIRPDLLSRALQEKQQVSAPMPAALAARLWNLGSLQADTPDVLLWRKLPKNFDPDRDGTGFEGKSRSIGGDGTVPGWSAFHAYTPLEHRVRLTRADDHTFLMEHDEVLEWLGRKLQPDVLSSLPTPSQRSLSGVAAPVADVRSMVEDIREGRADRTDSRLDQSEYWRGMFRELQR